MGTLVKFWDTGKRGNKDTAYRAPNGHYYSNKKAYDDMRKKDDERKMCIDEITFLLGYDEGQKPHKFIFKMLQELEPFGFDVVYQTLLEQGDNIEWALNTKTFSSETSEISYLFAIVRNHIKDVYKAKKAESAKSNKSAQIVSIEDFIPKKQKTKDISRFLDDD